MSEDQSVCLSMPAFPMQRTVQIWEEEALTFVFSDRPFYAFVVFYSCLSWSAVASHLQAARAHWKAHQDAKAVSPCTIEHYKRLGQGLLDESLGLLLLVVCSHK